MSDFSRPSLSPLEVMIRLDSMEQTISELMQRIADLEAKPTTD